MKTYKYEIKCHCCSAVTQTCWVNKVSFYCGTYFNYLWHFVQIDQDFGLLFGDATSAKLLEKWSTNIKPKVIAQSHGLTQTSELQDLIQNAEATEVEEGSYFVLYLKFRKELCIHDKYSFIQIYSFNCSQNFTH